MAIRDKTVSTATRVVLDKRPRQYAAEIARMPTLAARQAALEEVPDHLRSWVSDYVKMMWNRRINNGAR